MINTKNLSFNDGWECLSQFHEESDCFPNCIALVMNKKPRGIKNNPDWKYYINAIVSVLNIGRRNNWLRIHVDGQGNQVYWVIDKDVYDGKSK